MSDQRDQGQEHAQHPGSGPFQVPVTTRPGVAGEVIDPNIGLRGGKRIRVGESLREKILAADCGYLFENAIA